MEEQIFKMLPEDNSEFGSAVNYITAKEITSHVVEFIEWLINDKAVFFGELSEGYILNCNLHPAPKTIEELYNVWLKEVKQ